MGCRVFVRCLVGLQPHCVTSGWTAKLCEVSGWAARLCEAGGWVTTSLCDFWMGCRVFVRRLDGLQPHCVTSGWAAKLFEAAGWAAGLCEESGWIATSLCDFWVGCKAF